jgi:hypothetical protein
LSCTPILVILVILVDIFGVARNKDPLCNFLKPMSSSHRRRSSFREFAALQKAFPGVRGPHEVNQDWTELTSDKRRNIGARTFFLGEIFCVRSPRRECEPTGEAGRSGLGIVTRKQPRPHLPVEMAPEVRFEPIGQWVFSVTADELDEDARFLLYYRRPVYRSAIGRHVATIGAEDKARLASELFGRQKTG